MSESAAAAPAGSVGSPAGSLRARIEAQGASRGLVYPWWIAVVSGVGQFGALAVAIAERDAWWPVHPMVLALVVMAVPHAAHLTARGWVPWWITGAFALTAVGWVMATPTTAGVPVDVAVLALAVAVAEVTTTDGWRAAVGTGAAAVLLLFLVPANDDLLALYLAGIGIALVIGFMLRWQMRAMAAERANLAAERSGAALAERQRIAREIHDLVAHSLSVTLLHVTGARRALTEDADVADAVDALTDAERIGRQAMADIRRTVGILASDNAPRSTAALPGAEDIGALVEEFRGAGLAVGLETKGDPGSLEPSVGLCLYRVVQESLANVVKHAPGTPARVRLTIAPGSVVLSVRNAVAEMAPRTTGSGIPGMAARAAQHGGKLTAGPSEGDWVVRLRLPLSSPCPVRRVLP